MTDNLAPTPNGDQPSAPGPVGPALPDEALLIRLSAQKLWAEGQSSARMPRG